MKIAKILSEKILISVKIDLSVYSAISVLIAQILNTSGA